MMTAEMRKTVIEELIRSLFGDIKIQPAIVGFDKEHIVYTRFGRASIEGSDNLCRDIVDTLKAQLENHYYTLNRDTLVNDVSLQNETIRNLERQIQNHKKDEAEAYAHIRTLESKLDIIRKISDYDEW